MMLSPLCQEEAPKRVAGLVDLIESNHKFTFSMFLGGLLPGEAVELCHHTGDISSNDEFDVYDDRNHEGDVGSSCNTLKKKGKVKVVEVVVTHEYVNTKVKTREARMLKGIIMKAIPKRSANPRVRGGVGAKKTCHLDMLMQR